MHDLVSQTQLFVSQHGLLTPDQRVVIGVSGGLDSVCLLYLLKHLRDSLGIQLIVAHLNHQLRPTAQSEAEFVAQLAERWQIPYIVGQADMAGRASRERRSLEDTARLARYEFLAEVAHNHQAEQVAVAHHADDQAETFLLHLLRGSGLEGLQGMRPASPLLTAPELSLIRPLLPFRKADLLVFAQQHNLPYLTDESNEDRRFTRNRIRHDLLPQLATYNPNIHQILANTAQRIQGDVDLLGELETQTWGEIVVETDERHVIWSRKKFSELSPPLQRRILRRAVRLVHGSTADLEFQHIEQARHVLLTGQTNDAVTLPHSLFAWLAYEHVHVADYPPTDYQPPYNGPAIPADLELTIFGPGLVDLPNSDWLLHISLIEPSDINDPQKVAANEAYFDAAQIQFPLGLRTRRNGDKFKPLGLAGKQQRLKAFFINAKLPRTLRPHIPLLIQQNDILWLGGLRRSELALISPSTQSVLYCRFEKTHPPN